MSKNNEAIINRLNKLYKDNTKIKKLPLNLRDKYAIFSDLHLGDGGKADNFVHNEDTMIYALKYYKKNKYSIILLGDIEEFWQFDFLRIRKRYDKTVYELLRTFQTNSVHRVFGNHDIEWAGISDPIIDTANHLPGAPEAVMLGDYIFLVHGHQGDTLSDKIVWFSRFWVRVFKVIEPIVRKFGYENSAATKSQIPKDRERAYYKWAKVTKIILICGHTHRAIFASRSYYTWLKEQIKLKKISIKLITEMWKEKIRGRDINPIETDGEALPFYFNSGSGLYREGITNIEIENGRIRLIKWHNDASLKERRIKLWKEEKLSMLREKLK